MLTPGLIDSHIHFIFGGTSLISADVTDKVASITDLVAFVAQARKDGKGMRGDVLSISGMPLAFWSNTDELNGHFSTGASDWPVSSPNAFQAIYQAETRKGAEGVLDASQRMPREAMLYAYTRNSAHAMNQQDAIRSIAPGKQADLVLVDRDVLTVSPEELRETKVIWTMVGGEIVYQGN